MEFTRNAKKMQHNPCILYWLYCLKYLHIDSQEIALEVNHPQGFCSYFLIYEEFDTQTKYYYYM